SPSRTASTAARVGGHATASSDQRPIRSAPWPARARRSAARSAGAAESSTTSAARVARPSAWNGRAARSGSNEEGQPSRQDSKRGEGGARARIGPRRSHHASDSTRADLRDAAPAGVRSPPMPLHHVVVYVLTGAASGIIGAMLGLGGGVFLVPLLTLALHVP